MFVSDWRSCQELTPLLTTIKAHRIYGASISIKWCIIYLLYYWNPFRQNETKTFSCMMTLYQYPFLFQTCIDVHCFYLLFMLSVWEGWKWMTSFFYLQKSQNFRCPNFYQCTYLQFYRKRFFYSFMSIYKNNVRKLIITNPEMIILIFVFQKEEL